MILVATSVWIDHLRDPVPRLVTLLDSDEVGCHPLVIEELALGSLKRCEIVLGLLASLHRFPVLSHPEVLELVRARHLWGRGLSAADVHLLGSASLSAGARRPAPGSGRGTSGCGPRARRAAVPFVDDA